MDNTAINRKIGYQTPMFRTLNGIGRFVSLVYFCASRRISTRLFINANNGANGNADENIVTKPN